MNSTRRSPIFSLLLLVVLAAVPAGCRGSPTEPSVVLTMYVAPQMADCRTMIETRCLQVRESPQEPWVHFSGEIEGFAFEPGYAYVLRVFRLPVANPPADGSSHRWILLQVESKVPG